MRSRDRQRRNLCREVAVGIACIFFFLIVPSALEASNVRVKAAIKRGAAFVQGLQLQDGSWNSRGHELGETALSGLALLAAGYKKTSQPVVAAARKVRELSQSSLQTYDISLAVMFLDRVGARNDVAVIRTLGKKLAGGQAANGSWTYSLNGSFGQGDNSNAQFAILACWICRRHGAAMDEAILKADGYFRSSVNQKDGGWGYTPGSLTTPAMTCAGLVALATRRGTVIEKRPNSTSGDRSRNDRQDGARRDLTPGAGDSVAAAALECLAGHLRRNEVESLSKQGMGLYVYWSLERVGVIYGLAEIRGIDWYAWGAERLLERQRQDGGWGGQGAIDTAFAILFLSKANVAEDLTAVVGGWAEESNTRLPTAGSQFFQIERGRTQTVGGQD